MEFHNYLDNAGHMVKPNEFRLAIYQGGIEPSLRRVAWRHLLNIFPADMSANDRYKYTKKKEEEYRRLREEWRERFKNNTATEEVKYVTSMVKKDVLRTDRAHDFYRGNRDNEDNENTLALFHLLVTYALTHPDVSYCQGMSDLASPILVTQKNEGQAYICFCALMNRLRENFTVEGSAIMLKLQHLSQLLALYDPDLHSYFEENSAGDMFFCYRWLLLEMKREFPFSDALYVLEVMWATLPPNPPKRELDLVDPDYSSRLLSSSPCSPTFSVQQAMYAKLLAMRRVGALHRMSQVSKPTQIDIPPADDSSLNLKSAGNSSESNFDTSPGDVEDRCTDFPEVDDVLTRSLQQKSSSIDQVLLEGSSTNTNNSIIPEDHNSETLPFEKASNKIEKNEETQTLPKLDQNGKQIPSKAIVIKEDSDYSTSVQSYGSWSEISESPDTSEQVQFDLSLEIERRNSQSESVEHKHSNGQNSVISKTDSQKLSNIKKESSSCADHVSKNLDPESGILQSMKRLLASPARRSADAQISPTSSPKRNSTPKHGAHIPEMHVTPPSEPTSISKNQPSSTLMESVESNSSAGSPTNPTKPEVRDPSKLPPPQDFGGGNPFLMYLCFTLITMHREVLIKNGMCYEEIAMHFDRLVRRHNPHRVLHIARQMYTEYLKAQHSKVERERLKAIDDFGMSC